MRNKIYKTPCIEVIKAMPERILTKESDITQDHDADAKQGTIDTSDMWEGYEDIWATKPSKEVESPNVWGDE